MICDAHVHVGYFPRCSHDAPFYYSPRRMTGILKRCGIGEFIFSSTNAVWDVEATATFREAEEVKRLAGKTAHAFFWLTDEYFDRDPSLRRLPAFYEGIKLHGGESHWLRHRAKLRDVLAVAREKRMAVQIHTSADNDPMEDYLPFCDEFPEVSFDFAHGKTRGNIAALLPFPSNAWIDTAFCSSEEIEAILTRGFPTEKVMFGSDIPAPQRYAEVSLSVFLRREIRKYCSPQILSENFFHFLRITDSP